MVTQAKSKKPIVKSVVSEVQDKAKSAYVKGSAAFGEIGTMTKGNVAAVVASGKILGAGLKEFGEGSVAEGKKAAETLTADFKALAAVKSPVDFFQLQMQLAKRNFETAMALGTKNGQVLTKLASDAVAPIAEQTKANVAKLRAVA
jgi:hypothetical protein